MKTLKVILCSLILLSFGSVALAQEQADTPIPPEYQSLYDSLSSQLDTAEAFVGARTGSDNVPPIFGAELLPANGNRGEALLDRATLIGTRQYLDQLHAIGVGGVTLDIKLPVLLVDYPRSAEYLEFFRQVVAEVRSRGMTLFIESGPAFSGTIFSSIEYSFADMTNQQYFQRRIDMLVTIVAELQPDYLSIGTEVSTEAMLTGKRFGVEEYAAFVHNAAEQIRAANSNVKIGSGIGVWENADYVQPLFSDSALDFINLHFYPLALRSGDQVEALFDLSNQIKAAGKGIVIGEAWLYKVDPAELTGLGGNFTEFYARDVYSFWSPLDVRFVQLMANIAQLQGFEYVSFYWSTYFFGYVDYADAPQGTPPAQLFAQENRIAYANLRQGILSPTGEALQELLAGS